MVWIIVCWIDGLILVCKFINNLNWFNSCGCSVFFFGFIVFINIRCVLCWWEILLCLIWLILLVDIFSKIFISVFGNKLILLIYSIFWCVWDNKLGLNWILLCFKVVLIFRELISCFLLVFNGNFINLFWGNNLVNFWV